MNPDLSIVAIVALVLAGIPAVLTLINLTIYRPLPRPLDGRGTNGSARVSGQQPKISVLIPARDEERNLGRTLEAVLASREVEFEVLVLDDHSTDGTAALVQAFGARDPRVRLETAPALPPGWCGKQHACHVLASRARHPLLVFIDADVRLAPDALQRMAGFMESSGAALGSGVPRQEVVTFRERLLLPLIHFVLLGFLPMPFMRRTRREGFSAGCGQLFIARAEAYRACGGHAGIRSTLHDGVKLPRLFRRAGFHTDLFDATDVAVCRMYQTGGETWRGLGKNATEGLGAPGTIVPMTLLLIGGQVLPLVLWAVSYFVPGGDAWRGVAATAMAASWLPRCIGWWRFRQPWDSAVLHPLGVLALLAIQWQALARRWLGGASEWKGRSYRPSFTPESSTPGPA